MPAEFFLSGCQILVSLELLAFWSVFFVCVLSVMCQFFFFIWTAFIVCNKCYYYNRPTHVLVVLLSGMSLHFVAWS